MRLSVTGMWKDLFQTATLLATGTNLPTGGNAPAAGPVGVEDGLTMLQQALTAMAAQGAQIAVHDPNGGSLGYFLQLLFSIEKLMQIASMFPLYWSPFKICWKGMASVSKRLMCEVNVYVYGYFVGTSILGMWLLELEAWQPS